MKDKKVGFTLFISSIMILLGLLLNTLMILSMELYNLLTTPMTLLIYFGGILLFISLTKLGYIIWKEED